MMPDPVLVKDRPNVFRIGDELDWSEQGALWYTTLNWDGLSLGAVHREDLCPISKV